MTKKEIAKIENIAGCAFSDLLSASEVSGILNVSTKTLTMWYKWQEDPNYSKPKDMPKLPDYVRIHSRGPRYWYRSSIPEIMKFQDYLPRGRAGIMAEFNQKYCTYTKKGVTEDV